MKPFRALLTRLLGGSHLQHPPRSPQPGKQPVSGYTVKLIGYWAPASHWPSFPSESGGQPPWPDVRRAIRPGWRAAEREQLVTYLRNGYRCNGALGYSSCRFDCRVTYSCLGSGELTDGEWLWPEGLPHYVERHGVMLPEEFVASASTRGWRLPPIDEVGARIPSSLFYSALRTGELPDRLEVSGKCTVDHTLWLEWANGLPEVPAELPQPDPAALERFCLVLQYPDTDGPDEQLEGFEETVWDKVLEQYGRSLPGVGEVQYIEWVSVKHRDAVVALILDGIRRYGLTDRVKVICSEPDLYDWQRDRDVTVWPQEGAAEPIARAARPRE
jgi:hypothetical protein